MAEFVTQPYYSAAELAAMALHTIKLTARSIRTRAIEEGWESRRRAGRGGGNEYALSSLPAENVFIVSASAVNYRHEQKNLPKRYQSRAICASPPPAGKCP